MPDFEILPYVSVGPIQLGMAQAVVRDALGVEAESFMKSKDSEYPTDAFDTLHIHVYYRRPGVCEAVEFFGNGAVPTFQGQRFLGRPYSEVEHWVKHVDPDVKLLDTGLTSLKFGFGLFTPDAAREPDRPVESLIVFERGYYDK